MLLPHLLCILSKLLQQCLVVCARQASAFYVAHENLLTEREGEKEKTAEPLVH